MTPPPCVLRQSPATCPTPCSARDHLQGCQNNVSAHSLGFTNPPPLPPCALRQSPATCPTPCSARDHLQGCRNNAFACSLGVTNSPLCRWAITGTCSTPCIARKHLQECPHAAPLSPLPLPIPLMSFGHHPLPVRHPDQQETLLKSARTGFHLIFVPAISPLCVLRPSPATCPTP